MNRWDEMIARAQPRYDELKNLVGDEDLAKEIYNMGFSHGQQYAEYARRGFGQDIAFEHKDVHISCTSDGETKHYRVTEDNSWEEIDDPNKNN